ncbi:hypothetical protein SDC9_171008 [bioreactor metagenome]|uniref:Uncharacterized protein n=1 Tax=bioreactor metagenome TaxID=1076179 RepID=A0A645GAE6_9ZZZZ
MIQRYFRMQRLAGMPYMELQLWIYAAQCYSNLKVNIRNIIPLRDVNCLQNATKTGTEAEEFVRVLNRLSRKVQVFLLSTCRCIPVV